MYVIPAIDLIDGKCVRLIKGEYNSQITYEKDPVEQTNQFASAGAKWLHIIDLDGARLGKPINTATIARIIELGGLKIEVGGGIRQEQSIKQLFDIGAQRVIIGTKAISDFEWFAAMTEKYSGKIALGLDARGSKLATEGWTKEGSQTVLEFAIKAAKLPLAAIIYTDITKDGMMTGPNLDRTKQIADAVDVPVIASGGVNSIENIKKLMQLENIEAVIIGRALYEGTLRLTDAIKATQAGN